jgi:RimJ/RimL family protein N-acetyltransferase
MPTVRELGPADAGALSRLLMGDPLEYGKYFVPFASCTPEALTERLRVAVFDRYWGLEEGGRLVGFFMLRGLDEGFDRPSFGVYVAASSAGRGLAKHALGHAIDWCRGRGVRALMLKVHPENTPALQAYLAAGFTQFDTCPRTGHLMMQRDLV